MSDIKWLPDGQKMFEKLMAAVPEPMREPIRPKLLQMLAGKAAGQPVSGELVKKFVDEDLPEPQRSALMAALGMKPAGAAATPPPAAAAGWEGKAEMMFERMLQEVPDMMREVFRGKLMAIANQKAAGGPIKEEHITAIVKEIVPDPFKTNILKAYATMGDVDISKVEDIIAKHPGGDENLIAILHDVQAQYGYLPREALILISQKKNIFLSKLYRLATTYKAFTLDKPKKNVVTICTGSGCHVCGGSELLKKVEAAVSGDGADVTLEKVRCLGCCDLAPAVMINGQLYSGEEARAKLAEIL
ncbi:MAG: NAD(P)H-dependent oxidoreductase subunit E [Desulfobacterota bacterium]|nr:NAD(P)H-dependent oxidoreductase subunit E [Thermodesulfobacteriota bacterium]